MWEHSEKTASNEQVGSHQTLNLPGPLLWTSQPPALWGVYVCCLEAIKFMIFSSSSPNGLEHYWLLLMCQKLCKILANITHGTFKPVLWVTTFIIPFYRWESSPLMNIMSQIFALLSVFLGPTASTIARSFLKKQHLLDTPQTYCIRICILTASPVILLHTKVKKYLSWWHKQRRVGIQTRPV